MLKNLIIQSYKLYKNNLFLFLKISLLISLYNIYSLLLSLNVTSTQKILDALPSFLIAYNFIVMLLSIPLSFFYVLFTFFMYMILIYTIADKYFRNDHSKGLRSYFGCLKGKYWYLILNMLLWIVIIAVASLIFVIPGIYLLITLIFVPIILVIEDKKSVNAFKFSAKLVKNNFWRIVLLLLIVNVPHITSVLEKINVPFYISSLIFSIIYKPFEVGILVLLYLKLKNDNKLNNNSEEGVNEN